MLLNFHKPLKSRILKKISHVFTTKEAKYKNVIKWRSPRHFETELNKEFFSFINFSFVTRKWESKSVTIELVTQSEIFYFLTSS